MTKRDMNVTKERNYWLDNIKVLLILLVVVGHFIEKSRGYNFIIRYIYTFIYLFHMPLFVFVTGFFSKRTEVNKRRVKSFIVLYLIMQMIEITIWKLNFSIVETKFSLWYLQAIIAYELILPLINKDKPIKCLIISIAMGILIGFDNNANEIASLSRIIVFLPFFMMGYFTNNELLSKLKNSYLIPIAMMFLILISLCVPFFINNVPNYEYILWAKTPYQNMNIENAVIYRVGWYIVSTLMGISVLILVPKKRIPCISKFGERTLQVYCIHSILCVIFWQEELYKLINTNIEYMYLILGSVVLTFLLSTKIFSYPFDFIMGKKISLKENFNIKK